MGADIHVRVEIKPDWGVRNGQWSDGDFYMKNPNYGLEEEGEDERFKEKEYEVASIYYRRNYPLFALLAGVRNYYDIKPICSPRGVPEDCCESVREEIERWDVDGHSHSYFTLRELIEWDKSHEHKVKFGGIVSPEDAKLLDEQGKTPKMWCGWTSNKEWVKREWEEEIDLLEPLIEAMRERAKMLFFRCDPEVEKKIRIVFWFDN